MPQDPVDTYFETIANIHIRKLANQKMAQQWAEQIDKEDREARTALCDALPNLKLRFSLDGCKPRVEILGVKNKKPTYEPSLSEHVDTSGVVG